MTGMGAGTHSPDGITPPRRPRVQVLVVADSEGRRTGLAEALEAEGDIAVAGHATDAAHAVMQVQRLHPDVVTIDLPDTTRQGAIERIMAQAPTPILVLGAEASVGGPDLPGELMMAGALGAMPRPPHWTPTAGADVRRRVRRLRGVTVVRHPRGRTAVGGAPDHRPHDAEGRGKRVVAIAASTGGPAALATVLAGLAGVDAPVLVVQHIHADFVAGLVTWMGSVAALPVRRAVHTERLERGVIYIGPGGMHLKVGPGLRVALDVEPASTHRPSANELFLSVAEHAGEAAVGVVLTGMGDDGTEGLLAIRQRGGLTIAQDQATSAVFGMPHAAQLAGAASLVLPVDEIAAAIVAATLGRRA
jgi:two-component system chemotaxis response regulator CheB